MVMVMVIHAGERGTPKHRSRINGKLITDLLVRSRKDAVEKLQWYAWWWKIEPHAAQARPEPLHQSRWPVARNDQEGDMGR